MSFAGLSTNILRGRSLLALVRRPHLFVSASFTSSNFERQSGSKLLTRGAWGHRFKDWNVSHEGTYGSERLASIEVAKFCMLTNGPNLILVEAVGAVIKKLDHFGDLLRWTVALHGCLRCLGNCSPPAGQMLIPVKTRVISWREKSLKSGSGDKCTGLCGIFILTPALDNYRKHFRNHSDFSNVWVWFGECSDSDRRNLFRWATPRVLFSSRCGWTLFLRGYGLPG